MGQVIRIGTSGWTYSHWKELFFPVKCPQSKWLEYYTEHFDTVELNATFYRLPNLKTFENWNIRTPDHFIWSVKASKYITHTKRLKEPEKALERFFAASSGLKEKLGPILFQLPPSLPFDEKIFHVFCQSLKPFKRYALETRHPSWISEKVFDILRANNIAFCIADTAGRFPFHEVITANFIYIRLHGSQQLYKSDYSEKELQMWAEKIKAWDKDTYVYFDNDFEGYAVNNAKKMKEILEIS
jgi:uncharacterized protein YecE (DUF72 family)